MLLSLFPFSISGYQTVEISVHSRIGVIFSVLNWQYSSSDFLCFIIGFRVNDELCVIFVFFVSWVHFSSLFLDLSLRSGLNNWNLSVGFQLEIWCVFSVENWRDSSSGTLCYTLGFLVNDELCVMFVVSESIFWVSS